MNTTVYEVVTSRILDTMAKGTVPWRKTWTGGTGSREMPRNFVTKKPYRGINVLILWSCGFSSPDFLTFRQAKALGGSVRKGEHGMPVVFWKVYDGKTIDPATGKLERRFCLRYFTVFHVSQCDGLDIPAPTTTTGPTVNPIDACEAAVSSYPNPPTVSHGGDRACYVPSADRVMMPEQNTFDSAQAYYSVLFHELGHSTGHASRLDRKGISGKASFGSHAYSYEELVAECTAAFLCAETGIDTATIDNSAAYLANWIKVLKSEPKWIVDAAGQAAKAADWIMGRNPAALESNEEEKEAA